MLKNFFLYLSTQPSLRHWMEHSAVARRMSARFIAGNRLEDGLAVVRELHGRGILTALDPLGEPHDRPSSWWESGRAVPETLRDATT